MRKSVMMAGLALVALALGSPAFAVCVAPRTFASSGGTVADAYVYRSDVAAAWRCLSGCRFRSGSVPQLVGTGLVVVAGLG